MPKKSPNILQDYDLRYRRLFETAQDGILLVNALTGMIEDVNPFLVNMLGYSKKDILNKHLWEIGVFKDIAASQTKFQELQRKKYIRYENLPLETKDGRKINVEFVSNEYDVNDERVIQCNIRDITDRVKAELELHKAALRQEVILLDIPDIIMEVDNNKIYTWANDVGLKFFGTDVIGKRAKDYFIGTQATLQTVKPIFKGVKDVIYLESWQRRQDGEKRLLSWWCKTLKDTKGSVTGALSTARDITEQRQLEAKIQENEERYHITMLKTDQLIYEYFVDTGQIIWDGAIKSLTGYSPKEFSTTDINAWARMIHPDDRKSSEENLEIAKKAAGEYDVEYRFRQKNGKYIYIRDHGAFIKNKAGIAEKMYGTMADITYRKTAEDLFSRNEKSLRGILDSTDDGFLVVDNGGNVINTNNKFKELWHIPDDILNKGKDELLIKAVLRQLKDPDKFVSKVQDLYKSDKTDLDQLYFKDGRIFERFSTPLIINNKISGRVWSFRDITSIEKAKQGIIEENAKSQAILKSIGDAVIACDIAGNIKLFNKVAGDITGFSSNEAIEKNYKQILTFIREVDQKPETDLIAEALCTNQITRKSNHTILIKKNGEKVPVTKSIAPIADAKGNCLGCVIVFRDNTREHDIDKAKTEFVSYASHELRTPLATVNWYTELLLADTFGKLNDKQYEYTKQIRKSNKRMIKLVNDLLNVSRLELGVFSITAEKADFIDIVKSCIKELEPIILDKKLKLVENYDKNLPCINADPNLLAIIIRNVLSNSIKYTPNSGTITIDISITNNEFLISIADTGVGIPQNQQYNIFNKMFRADNAKKLDREGSGLGLYVVKEIVDNSGGKVWFESNESSGTKFYITYPLIGMKEKGGTKQLV